MKTFRRVVPIDLASLDWGKIMSLLKTYDHNDNHSYMITINKGQSDEYRTKFLTYQETMDIIGTALEKKRLRIPVTPSN